MTPEEIIERADERDAEILRMEPREQFDPCLVGIVERFNDTFLVYSKRKVLEALVADMDDSDPDYPADTAALEHYGFNILGGWLGPGTPAFLLDEEET
jgi:hypothetical protein